ncbi:MAG: HAD family hydrolase [Myxococcales bacterium]|nr:MAG: HAD family hydrolase [Myxococcales bacterium]
MERTPLTLAPERLVEELSAMLGDTEPQRAVLAFDGDGTLWSGDVGEDLFHAAMRESFLLEEVEPALVAEAARHEVPLKGARGANAVAAALFAAYLDGSYPERETCAMMTWCYAGRELGAVQAFAQDVLTAAGLPSRLHRELEPILEFAERAGLRRVLVSASPRVIVEPAGALRGFAPADIAAATPALADGRILARLHAPVPYAEHKLTAGRELFGDARWLAAFGDNVFDIDMLTTAELGVAVRPKPRLEAQLATLGLRLLARDAVAEP